MGPIGLAEVCHWSTQQFVLESQSWATPFLLTFCCLQYCTAFLCRFTGVSVWLLEARTCPAILEACQGFFLPRGPPEFEFWAPKVHLPCRNSRLWYGTQISNPGRTGKMSRIQCLPWSLLHQEGSSVKDGFFNPSAPRKGQLDAVYLWVWMLGRKSQKNSTDSTSILAKGNKGRKKT